MSLNITTFFVILLLIGLSQCDGGGGIINGQTIYWDNTVDCTKNPGCFWNTASNWQGGDIPSLNDTVILDLSNTTIQGLHKININGTVPQLESILLKGNIKLGQQNVQLVISQQVITITNNFTIFNGIFVMNGGGVNGVDLSMNSTNFQVANGGDLTLSGWLTVDALSTFSFEDTSKTFISGAATFLNTPTFYDKAEFYATGPLSYFYQGITAEGIVHLNNAIFQGTSVIQTLSGAGSIDLLAKSLFTVMGSITLSAVSEINVNEGAQFESSGSGVVYINGGHVDTNGTMKLYGSSVTVANIMSEGTIHFNTQNGQITNINATDVSVLGTSSVEISNSAIYSLKSSFDDNGNGNVIINLAGVTKINTLNSFTDTTITVVDNAIVTIYDDVNLVSGDLVVTGTLNIEAENVYADSILVSDPLAEVYITGSTVNSPITLNGGGFTPTDVTLLHSLTVNDAGYLALNFPGANFVAADGVTISKNGSLYIFDSQNSNIYPPFTVKGKYAFEGTLIMSFQNSVVFDASYPIARIPSGTSANFAVLSPLYGDSLYESQDSRLTYLENGQVVALQFYTDKTGPKKLAGWKVFLIILSILIVIGGAAFYFIRKKKMEGYIAIN